SRNKIIEMNSSKTSVFVLEDNFLIAEALREMLEELGYAVLTVANSAAEVDEILEAGLPDIALLDIDLGTDTNGIDVARKLQKLGDFPYIFLTGKDDDLTLERAKAVNPATFLLKPPSARLLKSAIEVALANRDSRTLAGPPTPTDDHLFIRSKGRYVKIQPRNIRWIEAAESYSRIRTIDATYTVAFRLRVMETRITHPAIVRVHRSFMVNLDHVDSIEENTLVLGDKLISVSRSYRNVIQEYFNFL
ncbi:MAG: response regulator transcription factor, partial [Bacteroidota bacterium]